LLGYLSEPRLSARIRCRLLTVDRLHGLARDVNYRRRERINASELHKQMSFRSRLMLILALVIHWQAKETSRLVRWRGQKEAAFDVGMLAHVSPSNGTILSCTVSISSTGNGSADHLPESRFSQQSGRYPLH
jgi:hypothetical protein